MSVDTEKLLEKLQEPFLVIFNEGGCVTDVLVPEGLGVDGSSPKGYLVVDDAMYEDDIRDTIRSIAEGECGYTSLMLDNLNDIVETDAGDEDTDD